MKCRRCDGEGKLSIKLGTPDPHRDTHSRYDGEWIVYPTHDCPVCDATGAEKDKWYANRQAGKRVEIEYDESDDYTRDGDGGTGANTAAAAGNPVPRKPRQRGSAGKVRIIRAPFVGNREVAVNRGSVQL